MIDRYVFLSIGAGLRKRFVFEFLVFARFDVYARTHTAAAAAVNAGPPRQLI